MKLNILAVTMRALEKSFPDFIVSLINNYYDEGEKMHYVTLVNQDFKNIYVRLDSDGNIANLDEIIKERNGIKVESQR